jgi:hypothetical protein
MLISDHEMFNLLSTYGVISIASSGPFCHWPKYIESHVKSPIPIVLWFDVGLSSKFLYRTFFQQQKLF